MRPSHFPAAACLALGIAGAAAADPADTPPAWLRQPSATDITAAFPSNPEAQIRGGTATVGCIVAVSGAVRDCRVISETPPGLGFGGAALALTPQFIFRPATHGGQPVEAAVNVPIHFEATDAGVMNGVLFSHVPWTRAPGAADLLAAYPQGPRQAGQGGYVVLRCFFRSDRVQGCHSIQEEPSHRGFAEAAIRLSERFRAVRPRLAAGPPMENTRVVIPFTFDARSLEESAPVLGTAEVVSRPSAVELAAAGSAGGATLACRIGADGGLTDCRAEDLAPTGQGVAEAALSLAPRFRMTLWSADGLPTTGAQVRLAITLGAGR